MRFTWSSNAPWAPTGYGNQTLLFVPRLTDAGHDIAVLAFYGHEGMPIEWNGIPVYPKGILPYGNDVAAAHTAHYGAKMMVSLIDAWVLEPEMYKNIFWIPWYPVDMEPLPPPVRDKIKKAFRRIVFSRFGERMTNDAGMDCYYIPHGIDCNHFVPKDKQTCRSLVNWPTDRYIIGMVAANKGNPSRKAFFEQIEAFAAFHKRHPDALLYLHTTQGLYGEAQGVNIPEFVEYMGITDAVMWCDQYINRVGFKSDYMVDAYNAMDAHLLASMGEGFGIPTLEAQACGTPVIVGDWTASGELCFGGWKIPKSETHPFWTPLAAYQYIVRPGAVEDALEEAYRHSGEKSIQKKARKGAQKYDADLIVREYWQPILAEIEEAIDTWQPPSAS